MENSINVIDAAIESNELNLKEVMDSVSNTITHWIVDRASTRFVIRKIGYNGFTVAFTYLKSVGEWSVLGYDKTPDSITFLIDNFGVATDDKEFYKASHAYSEELYGVFGGKYVELI
jgi:hypothetical protein|tara:strand:+ start:6714 stop:7064 length:351 start_codon:yes stop_codon:yes gene_type:complete